MILTDPYRIGLETAYAYTTLADLELLVKQAESIERRLGAAQRAGVLGETEHERIYRALICTQIELGKISTMFASIDEEAGA